MGSSSLTLPDLNFEDYLLFAKLQLDLRGDAQFFNTLPYIPQCFPNLFAYRLGK